MTIIHTTNDIVGKTFGRLNVLNFSHRKGKDDYYVCQCTCNKHTICIRSKRSLTDVKTPPSCGCYEEERVKTDILGKIFNNVEVLSFNREVNTNIRNTKKYYYICRCTLCGRIFEALRGDIIYGKKKSCGQCIKNKSPRETVKVNFIDNIFVEAIKSDGTKIKSRMYNDPRDLLNKQIRNVIPEEIIGAKITSDGLSFDYCYKCKDINSDNYYVINRNYLLQGSRDDNLVFGNSHNLYKENETTTETNSQSKIIDKSKLRKVIHFFNEDNLGG